MAESVSFARAETGSRVTVSDIIREAIIRYAFAEDLVPPGWNLDDPGRQTIEGVQLPPDTIARLKFG